MKRFIIKTVLLANLLTFGLATTSVGTALAAPTDPGQPGQGAGAQSSSVSDICSGVGAATGSNGCSSGTGTSVNSVIATVVNTLSVFVGILAVIMIIYAGFRYITSGGDSSKITSAKNTLIYAIVGLVVAALARLIVSFVLNKVG